MRDSFIFYRDWLDGLKNLDPAMRLEILEAIVRYGLDGELSELSSTSDIVFGFIKPQLDRAAERYEQICKQNRENGKKGGAPKGNQNARKTENNRTVEKTTETTEWLKKQPKQPKTTENNRNNRVVDNDISNITDIITDITEYKLKNSKEEKKEKKEKNIKKETEEKQKKFSPPSVDDVAEYCKERNNGIEAERFVDFYSSKGWMIGKNKMKDWKAAVRTWEQKRKTQANVIQSQRSELDLEAEERYGKGNYTIIDGQIYH